MRRFLGLAGALAALLLPVAIVSAHSGDGEPSLAVEPAAVIAGETVTLAGTGLEPDSDRALVLAGDGLLVDFGTVRTDAEGTFTKELLIPDHLPSGSYEVRAIGDETLMTPLGVTAVAGGAGTSGAGTAANETVTPRSRPPWEIAAFLASALAVVAAGVMVALRAERVDRVLSPVAHS